TLGWVSVRGRQYQRECTMSSICLPTSVCHVGPYHATPDIQVDLTECSLVLHTYFCSTRLSSLS
ncbi:unnamed protein product, partial [Ixodes pacificus]